jgi:hypothetical protein
VTPEVSTALTVKDRLVHFSQYYNQRQICGVEPAGQARYHSLPFATATVQTLQDNNNAGIEQVLEIDVEGGDLAQEVTLTPSQFSSQYPAETAGDLAEFASPNYGSVPITRQFQHAD